MTKTVVAVHLHGAPRDILGVIVVISSISTVAFRSDVRVAKSI